MTRVSTEYLFQRSLNSMLTQQAKLGRTQEQISRGERLLTPSDDPAGSARVLNYNRAIDTVTQFQENTNSARNRLESVEVSLRAISDTMPRLQELALQGGSGTNTAEDREILATEVRQLQEHFLNLANSRDANGEYLFSGFQGSVKPFTEAAGTYSYHGDMGQRQIRISDDRTIADSDQGFHLFMDISTAAGPPRNAFETIEQIAVALEANTSSTAFIGDLEQVSSRLHETIASVGTRLATIDGQNSVNADRILSMETSRAEIVDLDYAEAITRFQQQQLALEAAQKTFATMQGMSLFNYLR